MTVTHSETGSRPSSNDAGATKNSSLPHLLRMLAITWRAKPLYAGVTIAVRVMRAASPLALLWVGKLIIDAIVASARLQLVQSDLVKLIALEIGIVIGTDALSRASQVLESLLGVMISDHLSAELMNAAARLSLAQVEAPSISDKLERARQAGSARSNLLAPMLNVAQSILVVASLGTALVAFSPWLIVLLAVAALPTFIGETRLADLQYRQLVRLTATSRRLDYLRQVACSVEYAKEVRVFGLGPWLVANYRHFAAERFLDTSRLSVRRATLGVVLSAIGVTAYYGVYVYAVAQAAHGRISIGTFTFLVGSFASSREAFQGALFTSAGVVEQSLYLSDLFKFLDLAPLKQTPARIAPGRPHISRGLRLEGLGFRYPNSSGWALRDVSISMRPGERVALVGPNGSGKSTLVKLLCRLYEPTEGRILLDGVDLRDYEPDILRRMVSVVLQDFVRYDMSLDENIAIGCVSGVHDFTTNAGKSSTQPAIIEAALRAGIGPLVSELPAGYQQMLGRRFEGGVDISGGEWQKVALARADVRQAPIVILDEPTAALDAAAEQEIFARFTEVARGRLAVFISHRLSAARLADRVIVFDTGRVTEDGPHKELLGRNGLYSKLFSLQAAGYR